ncbi:hypothetical protein P4V47_06785 [Brevibacillus laterosporus]|uniref:hypothetical protein n=1 Tax=Brevibacillus laterosporus TaxID=1465 RepID=UPI001A7F0555|nr:hypothetical protein [Brevibacillus laterosporus]MBG9790500.1 hypothetical protein [Brevibacillus laterosporus]MED1787215.1 hypothetical protein [Brevibacillus laterosporus]
MKPFIFCIQVSGERSLLARERGLKLDPDNKLRGSSDIAPYTGAWIETGMDACVFDNNIVVALTNKPSCKNRERLIWFGQLG